MPAIPVHHTPTSDDRWDGPGQRARLRSDETEAYYRKFFAWQDPNLDATNKGSYKFIHHFVRDDGSLGPASLRAASNGIAILNGGRGGADVPDRDREGVWRHLAAHLEDAGREAPELRTVADVVTASEFRRRVESGGRCPIVRKELTADAFSDSDNHILFRVSTDAVDRDGDRISTAGWDWREYLRNPVFLWAHDYARPPIGRTVELTADDRALYATVEFVPRAVDPFAGQVYELYRLGFLRAVSVGFLPRKYARAEDEQRQAVGGIDFLEQELLEVSAVPVPANPEALARAKSFGIAAPLLGHDNDEVTELLRMVRRRAAHSK